jgi:hypothetical protein
MNLHRRDGCSNSEWFEGSWTRQQLNQRDRDYPTQNQPPGQGAGARHHGAAPSVGGG